MAVDVGIDLGSSKTVIFSSSKVVLEVPNVVTVDSDSWEVIYTGERLNRHSVELRKVCKPFFQLSTVLFQIMI